MWRYKLLKWLLSCDLTLQERNLYTGLLLDNLNASKLHDMIAVTGEGEILINGLSLDLDRAIMLRELAASALDNKALTLIRDQVTWVAVNGGIHNGDTPEKLHFYRAAIWWGQQVERLLHLLARRQELPLSEE